MNIYNGMGEMLLVRDELAVSYEPQDLTTAQKQQARENIGAGTGGDDINAQSKNVIPTFSAQEVTPDEGYNCLSGVTVAAIPVSVVDNESGNKTLTIG